MPDVSKKQRGPKPPKNADRAPRLITMSVRLPVDLIERLDKESELRGIHTTKLIRDTLSNVFIRFNC